jgi:hypothetical protein
MNLYPSWRLPDVVDANGEASIGHCEELMEDIFDHMQDSILNVLQDKFPQWKRNDSRTDSRGCTDIREGADSRTPTGEHYILYPVLEALVKAIGLAKIGIPNFAISRVASLGFGAFCSVQPRFSGHSLTPFDFRRQCANPIRI